MGRMYSGDIEGKFWFGVQSSDDASFFGGQENEPNYINYSFDKKEDLPKIEKGIAQCIKELGKYKTKLHEFFTTGKGKNGYNDEMLVEKLKIPESKVRTLLEWYARLELGQKILKCVKKNGYCAFEAET